MTLGPRGIRIEFPCVIPPRQAEINTAVWRYAIVDLSILDATEDRSQWYRGSIVKERRGGDVDLRPVSLLL